uniref:ATP-dependent DNA helicase n=1 Tax=Biomphalaria glabrata TaxID=6526 RepID=A0A2C9JYD4_BIOGL
YKNELCKVESELSLLEVELQELLERQSSLVNRRAELKLILEQSELDNQQNKHIKWEGTDFPWTAELDNKLKSVFKLNELRSMQRQTMNATLAKEDCLLIMPTGGGKSLCFQLPAVISKGLTLVISPLVSLMEDQQMALELLKIPSAIFTSATSKEEAKHIQEDMVNTKGHLKLLYVTPEKLAKSKRFMNRLEKSYAINHLTRIVIDEVHCCSQWGHDFRPDYKFLGILKRQFPNAPILGLTATATINVLEDVKKILNIPRALLFRASFNRPNLFYEVQEKPATQKDTMDKIFHLINKRFRGQSGIIYCFSRKDSEEVATDLKSRGIKAGCYHADMTAQSRSAVHRKWLSGDVQVVVATVAFGMGIDKPDVRFVIHHSISKSIENLYQESGRAGRDGQRSDCIVLYRLADVTRQSSMVFTEQTGLPNLYGIVQYCIDVAKCRRSLIARHFGEVWESAQCDKMCDHCDRAQCQVKVKDVTHYCKDLISILDAAAATQQRVTSAKLLDAWYGRGPAGVKVKSIAAPSLAKDQAERIVAQLVVEGYLREDFHFTAYSTICYIIPGPKAKLLRNGGVKVEIDFVQACDQSSKKIVKDGSAAPSSDTPHRVKHKNISETSNVKVQKNKLNSKGSTSKSPVTRDSSALLTNSKLATKKLMLDHHGGPAKPSETHSMTDIEFNFDDEDEGGSKERVRKVTSQSDILKSDHIRKTLPKGEANPASKRGHSNEDGVASKKVKLISKSSSDSEDDLKDSIVISEDDDFVP